jgi:hypothetical protein
MFQSISITTVIVQIDGILRIPFRFPMPRISLDVPSCVNCVASEFLAAYRQ